LCIIQAKRYSKIVGLEAVHALAGVMNDKSAAKGVLVTTSWVGKASRDFAARNGGRRSLLNQSSYSSWLGPAKSVRSSQVWCLMGVVWMVLAPQRDDSTSDLHIRTSRHGQHI
jgi:hypothetical protein